MLVVCLGLLVLAVAIIALREPNGHVAAAQSSGSGNPSKVARESPRTTPKSSPGRSTSPRSADSRSSGSVKSVPLVVLNNTSIHGLAQGAAQRFEAGGWTVSSWGNYQNDILSTCAYYDPSHPGAKAAAKALQRQFPTIKRVAPRFPELPSGPVVVVLMWDYAST